MDDEQRARLIRATKAYFAAQNRGRLRHETVHGHIETCCLMIAHGAVTVTPWGWDEDNNRVCAKCGESLEERFK